MEQTMKYGMEEYGFTIISNFFDEQRLSEMRQLLDSRLKAKANSRSAFPGISVAEYDVVSAADEKGSPVLIQLSREIARVTGHELRLYNSLYLELHGSEIAAKPGFGWHQDNPSFAILEKGTRAVFSWFILENTLDDGGGAMDFVARERITEMTGLDIRERSIAIVETKYYAERFGVDVIRKGKYVLLDTLTNKVVGFLDRSLADVAEKPTFRPGDLVICDKDIMHRTASTSSKSGKRTALTIRYVDPDARYNGCLDDGVPAIFYDVYENSKLWQRLCRERRGARICA